MRPGAPAPAGPRGHRLAFLQRDRQLIALPVIGEASPGFDRTGVATVYRGFDRTGVATVYQGSDVSGHGFSRAVRTRAIKGFSPAASVFTKHLKKGYSSGGSAKPGFSSILLTLWDRSSRSVVCHVRTRQTTSDARLPHQLGLGIAREARHSPGRKPNSFPQRYGTAQATH
jgi:hypothetical protein